MRARRIGRFAVDARLLDGSMSIMRRVMAQIVVVRCEMMWERNVFDYTALCDDFEPVAEGSIIPLYDLVIHGDSRVTFEQRKQ